MEKQTRAECQDLINRIINQDQDAFIEFKIRYDAIVHTFIKKWIANVSKATHGLYDYEDLYQSIYEHLLNKMKEYNSERSNIVTWMYLLCNFIPGRICRYYSSTTKRPVEHDGWLSSLDEPFAHNDNGEDLTLLDMLIDPSCHLENEVQSEIQINENIYIVSKFIDSLSDNAKLVYLHYQQGLTEQQSANLVEVSQCQISRLRHSIFKRITIFFDSYSGSNYKKIDKFAQQIMSKKDDEIVAEDLKCSLATIKICRGILSNMNIYGTIDLQIVNERKNKKKEKDDDEDDDGGAA